jgi:hypothetical protein
MEDTMDDFIKAIAMLIEAASTSSLMGLVTLGALIIAGMAVYTLILTVKGITGKD